LLPDNTGKPQAPPAVSDALWKPSLGPHRIWKPARAAVSAPALSDSASTEDSDLIPVRHRLKQAFHVMKERHTPSHITVSSDDIESTFLRGSDNLLNLLVLDLERALELTDDEAAATEFRDALVLHFPQLDTELQLTARAGESKAGHLTHPEASAASSPTLKGPDLASALKAFARFNKQLEINRIAAHTPTSTFNK
jgi:hypothetical protein